jgi:hypothetical protein
MKITLNKSKLNILNTKRINIIQHRNFRTDIKFNFPSGAIELMTHESNKKYFDNIFDFYMHIIAMPFSNFTDYDLPDNFFESPHEFEALTKEDFQYQVNGYFDSFSDLAEDNLWCNGLNLETYIEGFKIIGNTTGLFLIGAVSNSYFSFIYQSID